MKKTLLIKAAGRPWQSWQAAQWPDWPAKPVTLVVPYTAGGSADAIGRRLGDVLRKESNITVIVENKPGAGASVGTDVVARRSRTAPPCWPRPARPRPDHPSRPWRRGLRVPAAGQARLLHIPGNGDGDHRHAGHGLGPCAQRQLRLQRRADRPGASYWCGWRSAIWRSVSNPGRPALRAGRRSYPLFPGLTAGCSTRSVDRHTRFFNAVLRNIIRKI